MDLKAVETEQNRRLVLGVDFSTNISSDVLSVLLQ